MWKIMGQSRKGPNNCWTTEELDTASTCIKAWSLAVEYRIAFGDGWRIWVEKG